MITTIKLKYKIEILYEIIKKSPSEFSKYIPKNTIEEKPKTNLKNSSQIQNAKSLQISNIHCDHIYEKLLKKLTHEEKEDIMSIIKSLNSKTSMIIFEILNHRKFYKVIKSKAGIEVIANSYRKMNVTHSEISSESPKEKLFLLADEYEFYFLVRNILNITEVEALNLFDLFKFNEFMAITENTFIVMIYLFAAIEDGILQDFFDTFCDDFLHYIFGSEEIITYSRLIQLLMFVWPNDFIYLQIELNLGYNTLIDKDLFKEIFTKIAHNYHTK